MLAAASAPIVGAGVRASYYELKEDDDGFRSMTHPKSDGRGDDAITDFIERNDPRHGIWSTLAGRDTESQIRNASEDLVPGLNWDERPYKTFVTVPIKAANRVTFGMLTINAVGEGDLTELDRVCAIAMARILATPLAFTSGNRDMNTLAARQAARQIANVP